MFHFDLLNQLYPHYVRDRLNLRREADAISVTELLNAVGQALKTI
ncbi:MAG: hypothetical protein V3V22_07555 [Methylococcales bacterium]